MARGMRVLVVALVLGLVAGQLAVYWHWLSGPSSVVRTPRVVKAVVESAPQPGAAFPMQEDNRSDEQQSEEEDDPLPRATPFAGGGTLGFEGKMLLWGARITTTRGDAGVFVDMLAEQAEYIIEYAPRAVAFVNQSHRRGLLFNPISIRSGRPSGKFEEDPWLQQGLECHVVVDEAQMGTSSIDQGTASLPPLRHDAPGGYHRLRRRRRHYRTFPMKRIPNYNPDANTALHIALYRCDITELGLILDNGSDGDDNNEDGFVLPVVVTSRDFGAVRFPISSRAGAVGFAGPANELRHSFRVLRETGATVCTGGLNGKSVPFLAEFVQHYLRMGVGHFVLHFADWIEQTSGGGDRLVRARDAYEQTRVLLRTLIDAGVVALQYDPMNAELMTNLDREIAKNIFWQSCLLHAKAVSEFVGMFDIDEFWMGVNGTSVLSRPVSIPDLLRKEQASVAHADCPNWCYVTFPSLLLQPTLVEVRDGRRKAMNTISLAESTPSRFVFSDFVYQKSIARARNAFNAGSHTFGACLANGARDTFHPSYNKEGSGCSQRVPHLGIMFHFFQMFHLRYLFHSYNESAKQVPSEYTELIRAFNFTVWVNPLAVNNSGGAFRFNRVASKWGEPWVPLL